MLLCASSTGCSVMSQPVQEVFLHIMRVAACSAGGGLRTATVASTRRKPRQRRRHRRRMEGKQAWRRLRYLPGRRVAAAGRRSPSCMLRCAMWSTWVPIVACGGMLTMLPAAAVSLARSQAGGCVRGQRGLRLCCVCGHLRGTPGGLPPQDVSGMHVSEILWRQESAMHRCIERADCAGGAFGAGLCARVEVGQQLRHALLALLWRSGGRGLRQ